MSVDLTNKLMNFALTCDGKAAACKDEAAKVRRDTYVTGWDTYDREAALKIKTIDQNAADWEARTKEARRGFLLVDRRDVQFQFANNELICECQGASRVTYVSVDSPDSPPVPGEASK